MYKHPTNASTLGTCLKKIGKILDVSYIIDKNVSKRQAVQDFIKIYKIDFSRPIVFTAAEPYYEAARVRLSF